MSVSAVQDIAIPLIHPSPYQHRKAFAVEGLQILADSIARDRLIEPIVVRRIGTQFELIAGERRWRAVQLLPHYDTILARVIDATDLQARRMCATENMQREDLSAIETIEATVDIIDAELLDDAEYAAFGDTPKARVHHLLSKLHSDMCHGTAYFANKFISKRLQAICQSLPRSITWQSFFVNDLPLLGLEAEVLQAAVDHQLNKSQTKELGRLHTDAPEVFARVTTAGNVDPVHDLLEPMDINAACQVDKPPEPRPLRDLSAGELRRIRQNTRIIREEMRFSPREVARNWQDSLKTAERALIEKADGMKILLESIKREGGFDVVTHNWLREDTQRFGNTLIEFGQLLQRTGEHCLSLLEDRP